jgi:hypothetical protein
MFYQGRLPLKKKSITYISDSKSSLRESSLPLCAAMEAYRVVPINGLFSRNGLKIEFILLHVLSI